LQPITLSAPLSTSASTPNLATLRARIGKVFAGKRVLELACGTGYWTEVIASSAAQVTAVDANEEVLQIARTKRYPENRVDLVIGDCYSPLASGRRHDALFAGHWWSHVPLGRMDNFLQTAVQSVAPGAMIAFFDNNYVAGSSTAVSRRDAKGNSYQTRRLDDGSTHEVLKNFPSESELIQRASRHGWGAHVELLRHFWLLTFWAPK
jgi:2-polyprenyl-3-methyl-5-hydroxy-6-metoxy-1,4-benzoquinol methylase